MDLSTHPSFFLLAYNSLNVFNMPVKMFRFRGNGISWPDSLFFSFCISKHTEMSPIIILLMFKDGRTSKCFESTCGSRFAVELRSLNVCDLFILLFEQTF